MEKYSIINWNILNLLSFWNYLINIVCIYEWNCWFHVTCTVTIANIFCIIFLRTKSTKSLYIVYPESIWYHDMKVKISQNSLDFDITCFVSSPDNQYFSPSCFPVSAAEEQFSTKINGWRKIVFILEGKLKWTRGCQ